MDDKLSDDEAKAIHTMLGAMKTASGEYMHRLGNDDCTDEEVRKTARKAMDRPTALALSRMLGAWPELRLQAAVALLAMWPEMMHSLEEKETTTAKHWHDRQVQQPKPEDDLPF
jgi:hypothetical protein